MPVSTTSLARRTSSCRSATGWRRRSQHSPSEAYGRRCGAAAPRCRLAAALGRFLSACRAAGVPFKATAGLHHPLAGDGGHGFLNVIAACAFDDAAALSEAVELGPAGLRWRDRVAGPDELERVRREQLVAVGSCSFSEPVDDLKQLGVL